MTNAEQVGETRQDTSTSLVLSNGLELLSLVAKTNGELSLRDIGRTLGLSSTVTHRLVSTLRKHNFLEKNPVTGKYVIGIESFRVGRSYTQSMGTESIAKPVLQDAAKRYGVNCFLGVRKDTSIVYLYDFSGARRTSVRMAPGTEMPLMVTSMGIAILARFSDEELARYEARAETGMQERGEAFGADFRAQIAFARENGFARIDSEIFPGVTTVGAVINHPQSDVEAAISFGIPASSRSDTEIAVLGERVALTAERIEFDLSRTIQP